MTAESVVLSAVSLAGELYYQVQHLTKKRQFI